MFRLYAELCLLVVGNNVAVTKLECNAGPNTNIEKAKEFFNEAKIF